MTTIPTALGGQPAGVTILICALCVAIGILNMLAIRVARHLYRYAAGAPPPERRVGGPMALTLAQAALVCRGPFRAALRKGEEHIFAGETCTGPERAATVRAAGCMLLDRLRKCQSEAVSIRRGSVLSAALVLLGANSSAVATFLRCAENGVRSGEDCLILMVIHVQSFLAWGLPACAVLYAVSCWLERTIADREREWEHFASRVALAVGSPPRW